MITKLILFYLRHSPVPFFKQHLAKKIDLSRVKSPLLFKDYQGIIYQLYLDQYLMKNIYLFGGSEKNTMRHVLRYIKPGMVAIDAGANVGSYSLALAKKMTNSGKLISFEPLGINYERLCENIKLNHFTCITAEKLGLSNETCETVIFYGDKKSGASLLNPGLPNKESIYIDSLDNYCAKRNIGQVDFLKIDVEGAEIKVLDGAKNILAASRKIMIVLECMEQNQRLSGSQNADLFSYMQHLGFEAYLPRPWPFGLKPVKGKLPPDYFDNVIFLRPN